MTLLPVGGTEKERQKETKFSFRAEVITVHSVQVQCWYISDQPCDSCTKGDYINCDTNRYINAFSP